MKNLGVKRRQSVWVVLRILLDQLDELFHVVLGSSLALNSSGRLACKSGVVDTIRDGRRGRKATS